MTHVGERFEPVEGRAVVKLPPFRLEDRRVETLVPGDANTWIVVPCLDEERSIGATLAALRAQAFRPFVLCVVDNGSTDSTVAQVRAWAEAGLVADPSLGVRIALEPERGTGAAADTGMRLAIAAGARHLLRTDADSLPRADWAARMVDRLSGGMELVAGRMVDRRDERLGIRTRLVLYALTVISAAISVPKNRGAGYRTRFRMLVGSNVGITAATYQASGGFPRSRIDELHDDRALMNRVRRVTDRIASNHGAVVATSARRYRAYGLRGVIDWYLNHDAHGAPVDVR